MGHLGRVLARLGRVLGCLGEVSAGPGGVLGESWGFLGEFLARDFVRLGAVLRMRWPTVPGLGLSGTDPEPFELVERLAEALVGRR